MAARRNRMTGAGLAADVQAAVAAVPFPPPPGLTQEEMAVFEGLMSARLPHQWKACDEPLVKAYLRAWRDIQQIEAELEKQTFVLGNRPNPLLGALQYRMQHMATLHRQLGLTAPKPINAAEAARIEKHNKKVRDAVADSDDDDGLLAQPIFN